MGTNEDENGHYDVHYLDGTKHYEGLPEHLRANEVIWKNRPNPVTKLYGKAPATPSIGAIYADHNRARYNIEFFKNYGIPAMYVTITGDFDPGILDPEDPDYDVRNTLQYRITEQLKEVIRNPHSAMVLQVPSEGEDGNVKIDIQPLSTDTKEASFRLFRKDNRDEVIASHHMDPNRVGVTDAGKLGSSNSEMTNNAYRTTTIAPLVRDNEADINYILQHGLGVTDWVFKIVTTDDEKKHVDIDKTIELVKVGLMTPNEAREVIGDEFGLARVEEYPLLDEFYYNGEPLSEKFTDSTDLFGVDTILESLENDFMEDEDEEEDSVEEDSRFQKVIKSIRQSYNRD
jgi:capsid portal protein